MDRLVKFTVLFLIMLAAGIGGMYLAAVMGNWKLKADLYDYYEPQLKLLLVCLPKKATVICYQ